MKTPRVLRLVVGHPASGKTTFARGLALRYRSALLDIDTCTEPVIRAALAALEEDPDDRDSPRFKARFREAIYRTLFAIARANLPIVDVVVAGPFTREFVKEGWLEEVAAAIAPCAARIEAYYVRASEKTRYQRMIARGNPRDRAKLADWSSFLKYYGDQAPPRFPHTLVDTDLLGLGQLPESEQRTLGD